MKVALASSGSGSRGGGEIYLALLAEGLVNQGWQVESIVPDSERMDELAAMLSPHGLVHRIPFTSTYERGARVFGALADRTQQLRLAKHFSQIAPDILHVNQQVAEDGCDLLLAAKRSMRPWISTIHVGRSARELGAVGGIARDWAARQALNMVKGHHIAVSNVSRVQLASRFAETGARFHTVHNGVAKPDPTVLEAERTKARSEWGIAEGNIVIGSVGRIEKQKNPLGFVDAVARLTNKERVQCVWIGDGSLRGKMEQAAKQKGIRLHVDGWREDASHRMAGFDIFLLPSLFEGLPFAVVEAMHAGLPIIASNSDGLAEAIDNGVSGFLCNTGEEIAERLQRLTEDSALRHDLATAAQTRAEESFTLLEMARRTIDLYEPLVRADGDT